jgi:hypothetical protein
VSTVQAHQAFHVHVCVHVPFEAVHVFVFDTQVFHSLWKFALHVFTVHAPYVPFACKACVHVQFATVQFCVFTLHAFHTFVCHHEQSDFISTLTSSIDQSG